MLILCECIFAIRYSIIQSHNFDGSRVMRTETCTNIRSTLSMLVLAGTSAGIAFCAERTITSFHTHTTFFTTTA